MMKLQAPMLATLLALSGCAVVQGQSARDSEDILAEAGFHRAPQSAASGATATGGALPARQLTRVAATSGTVYQFYDPDFCHCVYVGGQDEYSKLQELRNKRIADHAENLRSWSAMSNSPDHNVWGPWRPEGLDLK